MEKFTGKIATVVVFFMLLFVFAKWGPSINFSTTSQSKGEPLTVTGEGKVYITPDLATITIGIEESGNSLKIVQDNVSRKTNTLTATIKKLGVKDEDIKTTSYNLYPTYNYESTPYRVDGYRVSTSYSVKIRDFDKINDIIVASTEAGANMESNIIFDVNEETKKEKLNEARKLATDNAKEKAEGLAKAAGITLGKIVNISEMQGLDVPRYYATGVALDVMSKEASQPSIEAGQTEIVVNVSLSYEVR